MRRRSVAAAVFLATVAVLGASGPRTGQAAEAPVSLELLAEPGFPVTGQQRWLEFLKDFRFASVRISGARPGDEAQVLQRGTDAAPRYSARGLLGADNVLRLPGAAIRIGNRRELNQWLEKLQRGGTEGVTAPTGVFGLNERQLLLVHDKLGAAVTTATKGKPTAQLVPQLGSSLGLPLSTDPDAQRVLAGTDTIRDEMRGLGKGTVLVAALRPLGLELVPVGLDGGRVGLRIARGERVKEYWPLGWKPDKSPSQLAPALFKFLPVEVADTPLDEALAAIRDRVEVPVLFDHVALARREIDLHTRVSLQPTKTFYMKIIDRLLYQLKLRSELRVDEAGRPFLWVTALGS